MKLNRTQRRNIRYRNAKRKMKGYPIKVIKELPAEVPEEVPEEAPAEVPEFVFTCMKSVQLESNIPRKVPIFSDSPILTGKFIRSGCYIDIWGDPCSPFGVIKKP